MWRYRHQDYKMWIKRTLLVKTAGTIKRLIDTVYKARYIDCCCDSRRHTSQIDSTDEQKYEVVKLTRTAFYAILCRIRAWINYYRRSVISQWRTLVKFRRYNNTQSDNHWSSQNSYKLHRDSLHEIKVGIFVQIHLRELPAFSF